MQHIYALIFISLLWSFCGCDREEIEIPSDWVPTEHKGLFIDSEFEQWNTNGEIYSHTGSDYFFYGHSSRLIPDGRESRLHFYKIMQGGDQLVDLSSYFDSEVKDIIFINDTLGYLVNIDPENRDVEDSRLYKSEDGGITWSEQEINMQNRFRWLHFISPDSGIAISERFYGTSKDVYYTEDGGYNWYAIENEFFSDTSYLREFHFIPGNPKVCFLSCNQQLLISQDGGFTWSLHSDPDMNIYSISFLSEDHGFISSSHSIFEIRDKGGDYDEVFGYGDHILKVHAMSSSQLLFMTGTRIYATDDGFQNTYQMQLEDPYPEENMDRFPVDFWLKASGEGILFDTKGTLYKRIRN